MTSQPAISSIPTRDQIALEDTWDLTTIHADDEAWETELASVPSAIQQAVSYRGRMGEGPAVAREALDAVYALQHRVSRLVVYASLKRDENVSDTTASTRYERSIAVSIQAGEALAWIQPEILALPEAQLEALLGAPEVATYHHVLDDLHRRRAHIRSEEVEEVLAQLTDVTRTASEAFGALDNADIEYGEVEDEQGNLVELSKARYSKLMESSDRSVRKAAFEAMAAAYRRNQYTLAALHGASVRKDVAHARVRRYDSALDEALFDDNLPTSVYHSLIEVVREAKPLFERSLALRKRVLGVEELHRYDLRVPLAPDSRASYDYREAVDVVLGGVSALGERYAGDLRSGFGSRWVDVHETQNKRSGAYSWGVYGAPPVMLMNWNGTLSDVFTLAHEAGHAMHTFYANASQPIHLAGYPIFLAEIASTVNEVLLTWHLLEQEAKDDPLQRFTLLNRFVEGFEATMANQVMYADFELRTHTAAESGRPVTLEFLDEQFGDVQQTYAPGVVVDETTTIHWARVPHFYRAYYVFQYATGLTSAINIATAVRDEGEPARARYLEMLSAGGSDYPLVLLQKTGVDLTTRDPYTVALAEFERCLVEMEELIESGVLDGAPVA